MKKVSNNVTFLGKGVAIDGVFAKEHSLDQRSKFYQRVIKDGCLYASSQKINERSDNSIVQMQDGQFAMILKYVCDEENQKEWVVFQILKTFKPTSWLGYDSLQQVRTISEDVTIKEINNIRSVCACFSLKESEYIVTLPNLFLY